MADSERSGVTQDAFFGGRLLLHQPAKGHRSGTDAVLLAAAVPRDFAGHLVDAGAGVGAVGLGVALACPAATVTLLENDAETLALAALNVDANGLSARVKVVGCDLLSRADKPSRFKLQADLVVTNPPFYRPGLVRAASDPGRRAAHVLADEAGLHDWLKACLDCLAAKGTLIVVHTAAAVPEMLGLLGTRLGDLTLLPIHPRAGAPAVRILLRGTQGRRAPFRLAPPLVLHDEEGFTAEAAALHEGTDSLGW